jgi:colanic acid/amylovoran biosynthesis glycosyltransferase
MRRARRHRPGVPRGASIALVCHEFPTLSETFIVSAFLGLLERGWDVHVICRESSKERVALFPELRRAHVRRRVHVCRPTRGWAGAARALVALAGPTLLHPRSTAAYFRRGWRRFGLGAISRAAADAPYVAIRPALIHFEFGPLARGQTYLKDLLDSRVVVSFRGADLNFAQLDDPGYYREIWEKADAVHVLGSDLWARALRRGCPPEKPHVLISPAIDTDKFAPGRRDVSAVGTAERPLRILSVGRLVWKKGHEYGLRAMKLLQDRGLQFECRIVGYGDYADGIDLARRELGLEHVVHLLGGVPPAEVLSHMAWADVLLHAAVSEGFCNAVMEAQAMELPVVCTDADGLPENVADGETGFVVPRRDAWALASKLALVAGDPALRRRLGDAGRRRVLQRFRRGDQLDAFERFYRDVLVTPESAPAGRGVSADAG